MRNLHKVGTVLGGAALVTSATMFLMAGCTVETIVYPDGGDAQPDTQVPDSPPDAGPDVQPDVDAGDPIAAFRRAHATAFCARLVACCAAGDAGTPVNQAACEDDVYKVGFNGANLDLNGNDNVAKGPNIQLDSTQAQDCITRLSTMSCPKPTADEWKKATAACYGAIVGKLAANAKCVEAIECQPGSHCDFDSNNDGGKDDAGQPFGKCTGLHVDGGACGRGSYGPPEYSSGECAYKGWGVPANGTNGTFCNYDLGDTLGFCSPLRAQGDDCYTDNECSTGYCDYTTTKCVTTVDLAPACTNYAIKDAGGGG